MSNRPDEGRGKRRGSTSMKLNVSYKRKSEVGRSRGRRGERKMKHIYKAGRKGHGGRESEGNDEESRGTDWK
jgi:hypothetical protein